MLSVVAQYLHMMYAVAAAVGIWAVMWQLYVCACAWTEMRHAVRLMKSCWNGDRCTVIQGNYTFPCSSITLALLLDTAQCYVNEFQSACSCFSELNKVMPEMSCAHVVCAYPQQSASVTEYCSQTSWWMPLAKCLHQLHRLEVRLIPELDSHDAHACTLFLGTEECLKKFSKRLKMQGRHAKMLRIKQITSSDNHLSEDTGKRIM